MNTPAQVAARLLEDEEEIDPKAYAMSMPKVFPGCIMARCTKCGELRGDVDPDWLKISDSHKGVLWDCMHCNGMTLHTIIRPVT